MAVATPASEVEPGEGRDFGALAAAAAPSLEQRIAQTDRDLETARGARERAGQAEVEALGRRREKLTPVIAETEQAIRQPMPPPPTPQELPAPPTKGLHAFLAPVAGEDPVNAISKLIQGISIMATGFTGLARGDATAALASMKGALAGWQEGDKQRADRHFADWKADTDRLLEQQNDRHRVWREIFDDKRLSIDQQMQMFKLALEGSNLELAEVQAATKNADEASKWLTQRQTHLDALAKDQAHLVQQKALADEKLTQKREDSERTFALKMEKIADRKRQEQAESARYDEPTLNFLTEQYLGGVPLSQLVKGWGKAATLAITEIQRRAAQRGSGGDVAAAQALYRANAQALGGLTKTEANFKAYLTSFERAVDMTKMLSERVHRSDTPAFNKWELRYRSEYAGDPDVKNLQKQLDILAFEFSRVVTRQGASTVSAQEHARSVFDPAQTHEQLMRGITDVLVPDTENAKIGFQEEKDVLVRALKSAPKEVQPGPMPMPPGADPKDPFNLRPKKPEKKG